MSDIVLPSLTAWAEQHLSAIIKATTTAAFDEAIDDFLAKDCNITVNGVHLSPDQYKQQLQGETVAEGSADVTFDGAVEVPTDKTSPVTAGLVGLFYQATIDSRFLIHDTPAQSKILSSVNFTIKQDTSLKPPTGPIHGFFDGRRVSALNQVFTETAVPVHFQPQA